MLLGCSFLLFVVISGCSSQQTTKFDSEDVAQLGRTEEKVYRLQGLCADGMIVRDVMLGHFCYYNPVRDVVHEIDALSKLPMLARAANELIERDTKSFSLDEFTNQVILALIHSLLLWERRFSASTEAIRKKIFRLTVEESDSGVMFMALDRYEAEMDEFDKRNGR
jgi:hypothetical protein